MANDEKIQKAVEFMYREKGKTLYIALDVAMEELKKNNPHLIQGVDSWTRQSKLISEWKLMT